jgi:hypothetical protein
MTPSKEGIKYVELIDHLNAVPPQDGWFSEHYVGLPNGGSSIQRDGLKNPRQLHNTRKLDGIREKIDRLNLCENVMAEMKWTTDWLRDAEKPTRAGLWWVEK